MQQPKRWQLALLGILFLAVMYINVAWAIFEWNNPTANRMAIIRDFPAVMTFQKLERYQGDHP